MQPGWRQRLEAAVLTMLKSPNDVIAMKLAGTITGDDLSTIMDRVEAALAAQDRIHIFVETEGIAGSQLSALPDHLRRALPLLGQLNRFGRVAVVADQAWMRAGTRLESALLPNISYRTCRPDEREAALHWVFGKEPTLTSA